MHLSSNAAVAVLHTHGLMCPYWKPRAANCPASVMAVAITLHRKALYCSSDDYDRCPLFLAKVLRGSSAR